MKNNSNSTPCRIVIVGEFSPPHAGMAVQAELLVDRLPDYGIDVIRIVTNYHFKGYLEFLNRIKILRGLIRLLVFLGQCLRIRKVDIVHIFSSSGINFYLFTVIPVVFSRLFRKTTVVNYHGGNAGPFFQSRRAILGWTIKNTDSLVVPSGFLLDVFSGLGHQSLIIPNVINTDRFIFRRRNHYRPKIVVCRNFTKLYNVACAIRAFAIVQASYPGATLTLAGDGPEREALTSLVTSLELENVSFKGNVSNRKMNEIYDNADIFLNTSNVDNMPNSVLEAFACGLPVVSTNPGGIPYMVEHGVTGLLAPIDDHEKLAKYMIFVIENHEESRKMVDAAVKQLESYSWENVSNLWLEHYRALLEY